MLPTGGRQTAFGLLGDLRNQGVKKMDSTVFVCLLHLTEVIISCPL